LREALKKIGRLDILHNLNNHLTKLRNPKSKNSIRMNSIEIQEFKKQEVEILHLKLTKYLERLRENQSEPEEKITFKFLENN
jgi:hypothetical protein